MKLLILSDIHGNLNALDAVLNTILKKHVIDACVLLGDIIDYGMHSNEVMQKIQSLNYPLLCNIRGNHEEAIIQKDYSRFSSERGKESARYTRSILNKESWDYITNVMTCAGKYEFEMDGRKCLAVHGSLQDEYWKSINPDVDPEPYAEYGFVFSGHSHLPHFFEKYVKTDNPETRNKKKIIFINPGSVGQPRNINNFAQYAVLDTNTEEVLMGKEQYNIKEEQCAYHGQVDDFYKERLELGV